MSDARSSEPGRTGPTVLVVNPGSDVYGSDLQMAQSVAAMTGVGWRVVVVVPSDGALAPRLRELGAETMVVDYPVLRRSNASLPGVVSMAADAIGALPRMRSVIRQIQPALVYVNTVTLPWWLLAARVAHVPAVCHVHEAEIKEHRLVRLALNAPLHLATALVLVSRSALEAMRTVAPRLERKAHVVLNCVPEPPHVSEPHSARKRVRLVVVGRLSPRKAPHVALEATALLRRRGREVELELCGSGLDVHRGYMAALRERAAEPELAGAVHFSGYTSPIWPSLADADILVAPSLGESFGLAVVEAQMASRPVVATAVQGHCETVRDGETGLLVPVNDAEAMAGAIQRLMDDRDLALTITEAGRRSAVANFSVERYRADLVAVLRKYARQRPVGESGLTLA